MLSVNAIDGYWNDIFASNSVGEAKFFGPSLAGTAWGFGDGCLCADRSQSDRWALADGAGRPWSAHHCGLALAGLAIARKLSAVEISPAPVMGWIALLGGLVLILSGADPAGAGHLRNLFLIPVIVGCVLISAGWPALRVLAFPIGFLIFAVPMPDWLVDAATVPLKVFISNVVTNVLYATGFPVAQNGVMIMIGTYQLLVKDACSGMNSIFALSAIGVFYAYAFRWQEKFAAFSFSRRSYPSPSLQISFAFSRWS